METRLLIKREMHFDDKVCTTIGNFVREITEDIRIGLHDDVVLEITFLVSSAKFKFGSQLRVSDRQLASRIEKFPKPANFTKLLPVLGIEVSRPRQFIKKAYTWRAGHQGVLTCSFHHRR